MFHIQSGLIVAILYPWFRDGQWDTGEVSWGLGKVFTLTERERPVRRKPLVCTTFFLL